MTLFALREPVSAWTHCAWLALSIPATWMLWTRCRGDLPRQISMLIYGAGLAACYAGSSLFHGVQADASTLELCDRIDHVGIYLLIAGSYTPLAWNMMDESRRIAVLASVWGCAFFGSAVSLFLGALPPVWSTAVYLIMGWGAIFCYVELLKVVSHRTLFPLLLGGILYSVGAVINLAGKPVLSPGFVGAHEIFHVFVMAGSLSHFWFMLRVVAPYVVGRATPALVPARIQTPPRPKFKPRGVKIG